MSAPEPLGWCVVEQLGHRRLAGYLIEVEIAGHGFLRLDIPAHGDDPGRTILLAPSSIYALHPCGETEARQVAAFSRPQPVQPWEMRAVNATAALDDDDRDEDAGPW